MAHEKVRFFKVGADVVKAFLASAAHHVPHLFRGARQSELTTGRGDRPAQFMVAVFPGFSAEIRDVSERVSRQTVDDLPHDRVEFFVLVHILIHILVHRFINSLTYWGWLNGCAAEPGRSLEDSGLLPVFSAFSRPFIKTFSRFRIRLPRAAAGKTVTECPRTVEGKRYSGRFSGLRKRFLEK